MDDFVAAGGNGQSCDPAAKKWKLAAVLIVTSSGLNLIRYLVLMANIYIVMNRVAIWQLLNFQKLLNVQVLFFNLVDGSGKAVAVGTFYLNGEMEHKGTFLYYC